MKRKRVIEDWVITLTWFVASVFATGAVWYFLSKDDLFATVLSGAAAASIAVVAIQLQRVNDRSSRLRKQRERLGSLLQEAGALGSDPQEADVATWASRVEEFLGSELDASYIARFRDFSGMTFYSGGMTKQLQGRSRRLHEFIIELSE
jgi:AcrR family transcriptional regulator